MRRFSGMKAEMEAAVNLLLMNSQWPTRKRFWKILGQPWTCVRFLNIGCRLHLCVLIATEVLCRGACGGKSPDAMCWAQHVSAKAWRFQNNLFQLLHSHTVTSIFKCCRSFLVLRFNTTHPSGPSRGRWSGNVVWNIKQRTWGGTLN